MKITQFTICLVENKMLGFFWVGDAITYFEVIYLPVVLLLMVLASFLIRQKDRRFSQGSGYSAPTGEATYAEGFRGNAAFLSPERPNNRMQQGKPSSPAAIPSHEGLAEIPRQIPA